MCLCGALSAIAEVGGVPFEILEPVLERCTPEQLYRIEQSNQVQPHAQQIIVHFGDIT